MQYREWPFSEARRILKRLERSGRSKVTAETGYGPSGLPHIGTFGEVARTSFVLQAVKILAPEVRTSLLAFSDDMDGLREVPQNLPDREMLKLHLGKPLTSIPDPFRELPSFAHYMNHRLREFLDSFGFSYELVSATQRYTSGAFDESLKLVMEHYEEIKRLFTATIAEQKRADWSPFFPICERCGRVYSTRVTGYDPVACTVSYSCDVLAPGRYEACGHSGTASIFGGRCKVGWKVDWALRWHALAVDYEMHGEDLTESARLSTRIVRLLGAEPPELFKYELFLDENGKKISKKLGNGVSIEQWLRYAPVDSLLYFMYVKPQQTKRLGLPILPAIIDQYLELVARDNGAEDSPIRFISRLSRGPHAGRLQGQRVVTYSMVYELVVALSTDDPAIVRDYLLRYQPEVGRNIEYFDQLIADCLLYYREVHLPQRKQEQPTHRHDAALSAFAGRLEALGAEASPEAIQQLAFETAKENAAPMKEWFADLYRILLGQSSGPRIGNFIALLGLPKALERIRSHLS